MMNNQRGVTLIELLAAVSLTSLLLWGILYTSFHTVNDFAGITATTNVRQVADFAMKQILNKLHHSGGAIQTPNSTTTTSTSVQVNGTNIIQINGNDLTIDGTSINSYNESYSGSQFKYAGNNQIQIILVVNLSGQTIQLENSVYYRVAN